MLVFKEMISTSQCSFLCFQRAATKGKQLNMTIFNDETHKGYYST